MAFALDTLSVTWSWTIPPVSAGCFQKAGGEGKLKARPKISLCSERRVQGSRWGDCLYQTQPQTLQHPQSRTVKGSKRSAVHFRRSRWKNPPRSAVPSLASLASPLHPQVEEVSLHQPSGEHRCLPPPTAAQLFPTGGAGHCSSNSPAKFQNRILFNRKSF